MCPGTRYNSNYILKQIFMATRNRVANDPAFERTRENMAEFERAGKAGKLLTDSFRVLTNGTSDGRMAARLSREMSKVLKTDLVSDRGQRTVAAGDVTLLRGFDFNNNARLSSVFFAPYTTQVDRAAGTLIVNIPAFVPATMLKAPPGATHFSIVSGGAEVNFSENRQTGINATTGELVCGTQTEAAITLSNALPANSTQPLFLTLGVKFYQEVNGKLYMLNARKYNPLGIILVDKVA